MHRFEWIIRNAKGLILDVGSNDSSAWVCQNWYPQYPDSRVIKDVVFFDCDMWVPKWLAEPKFVRGTAETLPFKNNTFNTLIFGDVLEHVKDPYVILKEAKRVSRDKIIITLPCEKEWNVPQAKPRNDGDLNSYCGKNDNIEDQEIKATLQHPSQMAKCKDALKEKDFKHLYHLQIFDDEKVIKLIESLEMEYNIFKLHYGLMNDEYVTYGIILWR